MEIVFMGTPDFAVPALKVLLEDGYNVAAVVTQPDRPKGRKRLLTPSPVKMEAEKRGIPVLQPVKLKDPSAVEDIARLQPDLIVTAAYGQILPASVLALPQHGCINVHGSLLPLYRGGAPIQRAVMNGDKVTGVTIMYMEKGLDTGDMISKVELPITDADNSGTMFDKLSIAGAELLRQTLPDLLSGKLSPVPQNHNEATYAPNLSREDERIDWNRTSLQIFNQVRGLNPLPGAFTMWNGAVLKIWACRHPQSAPASGENVRNWIDRPPGTVLEMTDDGMQVRTGDGAVWLTEIQPAGKKAMDAASLLRGGKLAQGTVLS